MITFTICTVNLFSTYVLMLLPSTYEIHHLMFGFVSLYIIFVYVACLCVLCYVMREYVSVCIISTQNTYTGNIQLILYIYIGSECYVFAYCRHNILYSETQHCGFVINSEQMRES